jgi:hypothetical protein
MVTGWLNITVIRTESLRKLPEMSPRAPLGHGGGMEARKLRGTPMKAKKASRIEVLPERTRRKRVWVVRRQLKQGRYDVDSRLAAVLNRVLEDVAV